MCLLSAIALTLPVFKDHNAYTQNIIQNVSNTSNSTLFVVGNAQTMVKPDKVTLSLSGDNKYNGKRSIGCKFRGNEQSAQRTKSRWC
jgi:hypothetical protein